MDNMKKRELINQIREEKGPRVIVIKAPDERIKQSSEKNGKFVFTNENVFYKEGKILSPDETREVREQMKKNSERLKELIGE